MIEIILIIIAVLFVTSVFSIEDIFSALVLTALVVLILGLVS
jgi:hypothetical protein